MTEVEVDMELDCSGQSCPLPVLKTKKAMDNMESGQILRMVSTDPGAVSDMDAWTKHTGNELVASDVAGPEYVFYMRKK